MPPKKKLRTQLAEDDGSGRPRKWIPVNDSASARAQRVEKRWIQLADEAEAAAKLAAQQERLAAEDVVEKHGDSPEEDGDGGVRFKVTLDRKPKADKRSKPVISSSQSGSDPEDTQFEVTLTGPEDKAQSALVNESHVRDFTEGAAVQPAVTAEARRRKCADNVVNWDRYLVDLLSEVFSSAKDVVLVLDTTIMAVRWWPLWQQAIGRQMMPPGGGKPRVVAGMTLDDMRHLTRAAAKGNPAKRGAPGQNDAIASLTEAFSSWRQRKTSRLLVLVPLKDDYVLRFTPGAEGGTSLMKTFKMGREIQALGIKCLLVLLRGALGDFKA